MNLQLPTDIDTALKSFLVGGRYENEVEVLREALTALKRRDENEDIIAIQEGIDDEAAGRVTPARTVIENAMKQYGHESR